MNRIYTVILFPFQKRISFGLFVISLLWSSTVLSQTTTQTFTVPGPNTFSVPPGIVKVTVKAWGGGGGGGGADSNSTENRAGGGGGGGAFVLNNNVTVTPGVDITVTVGAGGTPGTNPTIGGTGGTSTFASAIPVNAPGGVGGTSGLPADRTGAGGAGGTGTNNGGAGAEAPNGGGPDFNAIGSGGGGGAGGEIGVGGNASGITAGAGGTGGGGAGGAGLTSAGNGNPGNVPGGGGSGGWDNLGNLDRTGGAGARGEVIVSYTQATAAFTRLTPAAALTNATSVTFRVTFTASVTGIDVTDFAKTGAANGTLSSVANITATTVDVIFTGVSGTGNLGLNFAGGATNIINADGNTVNLTPTTDEEYTIDTTAPTVVLTDDHPDGIVRDADNVVITATFTEANGLSGTPTITIGTVVTNDPMTGGPLIWTYNWDVPSGNEDPANVTITVNDAAGNPAAAPTGQTSYNIDNTAPTITSVTSNATAAGTLKIGDQIVFTVDIQTTEPGLTIAPTSYNGGTLTWSTSNGGDTYTATYTVVNGQTDRLSALQLTGVTATDVAGNPSSPVDGSDVVKLIDANNPPAFTTGAVTTVTAPVVTGYWNANNTGLHVTVPIPSDVGGQFSLVGGTVQIQGRVAANAFVNLGSAETIMGGEPGTNKTITNITAAQFEALTSFANGQTAQLRAVITDVAGNSTTGATSATNISIDQSAPAAPAAFSSSTTGGNVVVNFWNSHNTGVTLPVVIPNQSDLLNGTVEVEAGTVSSGTFAPIATTSSAIIGVINTTKNITMNAAAITGIAGYAQGQLLRFRVRINDIAGNSGPYTITTNSLTVDIIPPTISGTPSYSANAGARETIVINFSETINLSNGALPVTTTTNGNPGFYSNQPQIRTSGLTAYTSAGNFITLESNSNGQWSSPVLITYTSNVGTAGNYIRDAAGNELTTVTVSTNSPPPVLASGMVLNPNGTGNETITFTVDALLNTPTTPNAVTGITVDADGPGAGLPVSVSGTYTTTGNIITLTSSSDGLWTTNTTVSYAGGNIASSGGTPMAAFGPEPILLAPSITSNNANPLYATSLGTPNTVTITFTTARTLTALPTVFIDPLGANLAATVTPPAGPFTGPFTATVTMTAGVTEGILTFSITALETGKSTTTSYTTDNSIVIFDKTPPAPPSIPDLNASDDSGINNDNYTNITSNLTFTGTCENNAIVEIFDNLTPLGTAITTGTSWTIDLTLAPGTYAINATATDAASNTSVASGNLALTIDTTPPGVTSVSLPDANPNNTTSVNFSVVFNEAVTGVDATDFSAYGSASFGTTIGVTPVSPTTYTVTVSGITLTGLVGLDVNDNNSIIDLATNPLGGPGVAAPFFSSASQYTMILPEPPNHATAFTVGTITPTSINLTWTDALGTPTPTGYLITASRTGSPATPPADFGTPVANQTDLVNNTTGYINVPFGVGSYTFSNLLSGKDYIFKIYPYTNTGSNIDFKLDVPTPAPTQNASTTTAALSTAVLNSVAVPISSLKNSAGNSVSVMQFTLFDDSQSPLSPNVMPLYYNDLAVETIVFTLRDELTLSEGASVTGFTSSTGTVASAIYTGKGTTNTITLTNSTNGSWTSSTTISYSDITGNAQFVTLGKMQSIFAHAVVPTEVFYTSSGTFTVPSGVTNIIVEAWGGGGSGGVNSNGTGGGGGGGGGAYSRSALVVTPGNSYSVIVGNGAAGATLDGITGGTSTFGGALVRAVGGNGGLASDIGGSGGSGGNLASGVGTIRFSGGNGGNGGVGISVPGGGGGSSAGTSANGNPGASNSCPFCFSPGGIAPPGGGNGATGPFSGVGQNGFFPGGGGSGTGANTTSGAGANGQIKITYSNPSQLASSDDWDSDNAPFKFSQLVINQGTGNSAALSNWQDIIEVGGAELYDGINPTPIVGTVNPTNITFASIPSTSAVDVGFIADANGTPSSKTYTLKIWLKNNLNSSLAATVDGLNLAFSVNPTSFTYDDVSNGNQKSSRLVSTQPTLQSGTNPVEVIATQLDFSTSPNPAQLVLTNVTSTSVAPDFLTRPRIRARDANGNTDLNYTASITLTNAGTITMNPNPVSMVNGLATFPVGFQYQDAGDGTLTATTSTVAANSLVPAPGNSTPVTVSYSNLSTLQPGTLTTPTTFSSLNTGGFIQVFDFRVVEDNGSGGDGSPTRISQIVYTQGTGNDIADWSQAISQAALWDGVNPFITGTIGATTITFNGINTAGLGFVGDNAIKNYQLYITLKPNLGGTLPDDIDNRNFVFEVLDDNISLAAQSSLFTGSEVINSGATNIAVDVVATKLQFDTNPAAVLLVGKDISLQPPVPVVEALDVNNNRDLNYNSATVTVTNSLGLTMTNSPGNASIVSGLLTFPNDFRFNTTGTGATLTVASTGPSVVSNATSTAFDVRGGVATTITAGALTEPLTISSLVDLTHTPAGLAVFDFNINDDPGGTPANEDDGNPTQLTSIFITSGAGNTITNWSQAIETATLSDGTNTVSVTTIDPSNYLYFDLSSATGQLLGLIADDATKTYVLTLWLKTALGGTLPTTIDGLRFVFDVQKANIALGPNSTNFLGTPQTQNSGAGNNLVSVVATELHFTTPAVSPAVASLNSNFAATVQARDVNNNRDLDFTGGGSTITALTNATNATMSSTPPVVGSTFTAGVFNFPGDFQFISGNNNDDVTLSMIAGGINSVAFPAPFTPQIILQSSFESLLVVDPGFTPTPDLPYKDFQNIATTATSIALAQFKLSDGNGVTPDSDGASTNIETLELSITNPDNIRSLGLYLGTSLIQSKNNADFVTAGNTTVTFTGLSGAMIAPDNGSLIITVRASFYNTDANITDNEVIQLQVVDVTQNGGSQFNNIGTAPLIGGITGGALTDGNVKIEVTATRLDFIVQPVPFEGIQRPLASTPQVRARDVNAIVDLDHTFVGNLTTPGAALTTTAFNFTNGIVDFTGLQYVSPGDGTITITSNGLSSASGGSIICNHVDVINVFSTYASSGVITSPNLPGGAINRVIFGVTFNTPYSVTGEPKLNSFVINFSNPISGIFTNIRVFESTNTAFDVTDANIVTTPSIGGQLTAGSNFLTVDFTGGTPRDLSLPANTQLTYFLMVDVSPTASGSTPKIQPSVVNNDANIIISNGSVYSTQNTIGQEYTFASIFPPTLVSSYPATGQLNVDKNQPTVDLVFSVPVWSLDQKILLYDQSTGLLVQELAAVNGQYPGTANLAGTVANPLKFSLPPLQDDRVYYITIAQGDFENDIGIVDESLNEFPGFTYSGTLYFKTANPNPPILLNNNSVPVANNPTITSVTLTGATINATFDQQGTAYFLVVNQGDPAPTNAEIKGTSTYVGGTVIDRGVFAINQVNPISQFGQITADLTPSTTYNVWMYAANNALPTPIETTAPYGSIASNFAVGGAGPTLTFTSPATAQPSGPVLPIPQINVCRNSFQTLNLPLQIVEGNTGDFAGGGTQVFNLLLPSGFQFDVTTTNGLPTGPPVHGTLTLTGSDFTGTGTLRFINNTTLRVSFQNSGNTSRDNITISGLRILTTAITSGNIVRLGGNAIPAAFPDLNPIATISSFDAPTVDFTNEYTLVAFPNSSTPITILPDDQGQVELIPLPAAGDYGPNAFSGSGVNINQLNVTAVTKDAPFNITLTHTDNNGCISQNPIQYTVYDSKAAIKGLSSTFCIDNINFPANATLGTPALTQTVLFTNLGAHFMDTLKANVPFNVDPTQIINGPDWISILKTLPVAYDSVQDPNDPLRYYRSYRIDGAKILNANTLSGGTIPNPYSHFINTTLQGNTYYDGGSLGLVEFTGQYQNQANQSVYIPLRQNVEFFVPAVPIVEVGLSNQSALDAGVPIFCEQGGNIVINGFPAASVGSSVGFFSLENNGTIIHARDLTVAITAQANNGGNFQITLSKPANLVVGNSIQIFGVTGTLPFSSTHAITSKISDSVYVINRAFNAGSSLNAAKVTISLSGFTDNSNGTAELDPTLFDNGYGDLRVNYTYKSNDSPCESTGGLTIRIEPNPVALFTYGSVITPNTPLSSAICEGIPVDFNGSTSTIAQGTINTYSWNFSDATNETAANPNAITAAAAIASHIYIQSAPYNPSLIVTSTFGCRSVAQSIPLNVGIIPIVGFTFEGVSTATPLSFTNTTVIPAGSVSDGLGSLTWDYDDGNTATVSSNFTTAVTNNYTNPDRYDVSLEVTSLLGCTNELAQKVIVVPQFTPTDLIAYEADFETGGAGWQPDGFGTTPASWADGIPSKQVITLAQNNGQRIWTTGLTTSYGANERSALYSPSFDLSQLDRPMISLNTFRQLAAGEGVVLEFSIDNKNVADPTKQWTVLGKLVNQQITGVGWYNGIGLSSQPGNQTQGFGWTGQENNWRDSKHVLDTVLNQSQVVFRFALATQTASPTLDGFAIDNVRVGNRTRTILVENFKNAGRPLSSNERAESDYLKTFKDGAVGTKLVTINYHVGFPQVDPFNQDNPADPSSRALYYNIASTPIARLDGGHAPLSASQPFSQWGEAWYDEQTLKLANARIIPNPVVNPDGSISIDVDVEAISIDLPANTILHVAVVEKSVTALPGAKSNMVKTGETDFEFVLKKLLPSGAGTVFGQSLVAGNNRNFTGFTWTPEPTRLYPDMDDLAVIAFVQNEVTKEVYQAEIVDVGTDPPIVTGLGDIAASSIEVYPNPANKEFVIKLPAPTLQSIKVDLIDQVGKTVHGASFSIGDREQTLNIEEQAAGIYILQLRDSKGSLIRRKLMITH